MVKGGHFRCPLFFTSFWAAIEVVPKAQIRFKGKASRKLKTERTRKYVSISICGTTLLSDIRWGFETTSKLEAQCQRY